MGAHLARRSQRLALQRACQRGEPVVFDRPHGGALDPGYRYCVAVRQRQDAVHVERLFAHLLLREREREPERDLDDERPLLLLLREELDERLRADDRFFAPPSSSPSSSSSPLPSTFS